MFVRFEAIVLGAVGFSCFKGVFFILYNLSNCRRENYESPLVSLADRVLGYLLRSPFGNKSSSSIVLFQKEITNSLQSRSVSSIIFSTNVTAREFFGQDFRAGIMH